MPQPRQRIVFCDCLDCLQQPPTTDIQSTNSPANEAVARQEPPPKCLMFVLSGVLLAHLQQEAWQGDTVLDTCHLPHIDRATAHGNLCFLTIREGSPSDSCSEIAQMLGVYEEYVGGQQLTSLSNRFKGMQASFSTNNVAASKLAAACGLSSSSVLQNSAATDAGCGDDSLQHSLAPQLTGFTRKPRHAAASTDTAATQVGQQLPDPDEAARRVLQELGLQQADAGLDMLIANIDVHSFPPLLQQQSPQQQQVAADIAAAVLRWVDRTLRYLNNSTVFKDTVLLTVLATPGAAGQLPKTFGVLDKFAGHELISFRPQQRTVAGSSSEVTKQREEAYDSYDVPAVGKGVLRPLQSWQQLAGQALQIDARRPLLCMRRLPGVVRRDECTAFSLKECAEKSGVLGLLADRLVPEIAYKLGRAPKYGA